jgi:hypothetical protein
MCNRLAAHALPAVEEAAHPLLFSGFDTQGIAMASYSKKASTKVAKTMHERKTGTLKSGRSGKTVKSRKQAIAIGLSEARKAGAKVPSRKSTAKTTARKSAAKKAPATRKTAARKTATRKTAAR